MIANRPATANKPLRYRRYFWMLVAFWTLSVGGSLAWNLRQQSSEVRALALQTARALYDKDLLYREWASGHGGVYVPVSEGTLPNPHLKAANRDITTPAGVRLTLMNPAYMTRQVFELQAQRLGIQGHITSLKPVRAENAPDEWEAGALEAFERGAAEVNEVTQWRGRAHLRLMKPLVTTQSCLRCHREQGYRAGDIRGGISVAVPMALFGSTGSVKTLALAHGGLWLLGLAGMGTGWSRIRRHLRERDEANVRLQLAKEEAEIANQAKSTFLATMSHEIRTPLNGVIGMAGLLLDSPLSREQRRYAEVVRTSADSLLDIINDILDFSKIEAGRLELENIPFDLRDVVEDATELMAVRAYEKRLEVATLIEHDVPTSVAGDPTRLRQILINLMGNAIKFTAAGEVVVRVTRDEETPERVAVRFTVSDTGVGIPADRRDRLFKSFSQVDAATTRRFGGTGLGLAICKRLAEAMQGRIGVESQPGKGSTFWFTVSLQKKAAGMRSPPEALAALRSCRFLIVDDNATNRLVLKEQLRTWGCACAEAGGPVEALAMLSQAQASGEPFHVALLDMEMPEMDGVMLGRKIRGDARLQATRLVLLTSCTRPGDGRLAQEAGFSAYLSKPAKQAHLRDCLAQAVGLPSQEAMVATSPAEAPAQRNVRILLADDNKTNQMVALATLKKLGFRADPVSDGEEVVAAWRAAPYDVILMDIEMPRMDGFQATAKIREEERSSGRRVAIIAMTAHALKGDRERCLAAGMDGYVTKPIRPRELAEAIEAELRKVGPAAGPAAPPAPGAS